MKRAAISMQRVSYDRIVCCGVSSSIYKQKCIRYTIIQEFSFLCNFRCYQKKIRNLEMHFTLDFGTMKITNTKNLE